MAVMTLEDMLAELRVRADIYGAERDADLLTQVQQRVAAYREHATRCAWQCPKALAILDGLA
jgi:hypothetical protein